MQTDATVTISNITYCYCITMHLSYCYISGQYYTGSCDISRCRDSRLGNVWDDDGQPYIGVYNKCDAFIGCYINFYSTRMNSNN